MTDLIPIKQYAEMHGIDASAIRQRIKRGIMPGAIPGNLRFSRKARGTERKAQETMAI